MHYKLSWSRFQKKTWRCRLQYKMRRSSLNTTSALIQPVCRICRHDLQNLFSSLPWFVKLSICGIFFTNAFFIKIASWLASLTILWPADSVSHFLHVSFNIQLTLNILKHWVAMCCLQCYACGMSRFSGCISLECASPFKMCHQYALTFSWNAIYCFLGCISSIFATMSPLLSDEMPSL